MVDSEMVLTGQTIAYTIYCIVIILLVAWFAWKVTGKGKWQGGKTGIVLYFCRFSYSPGCFIAYHYL